MRLLRFAALAFILFAAPAFAQTPAAAPALTPAASTVTVPKMELPPASTDPSTAPAGVYKMDKSHARLMFSVKHMGFSIYHGQFNDFDTKLTFDPQAPEKMSVEATVQIGSVDTKNAKLEGEIKEWFKSTQFATATFRSSKITKTGPTTGELEGELTMAGVTKPIKLNVSFVGHGQHPMTKKPTMGFTASGVVKRSLWGVSYGVPMVGDDVNILIDAEFNKADASPAAAAAPMPAKK